MYTATTLAADRAHVEDIKAQILVLKRSVRALRAERKETQGRIDSYAYPVLTLPNEIVSEIFVNFLPVYPCCPPQTGLLSPTLLTHICRRWRGIALATPELWRAILITSYRDDGRQLHILDSWLSRSGCFPLSLNIENLFIPISKECLEKLVQHHARWEHVKLGLEARSHLRIIPSAMPLLCQLELQLLEPGSTPPVAYREVPRLRSAILWDFDYPNGFLPWSQLTSLTLVVKSPTECTAVLQHTVNLVHCELVTFADFVRQPDVKLERLNSLVLMKYTDDEGEDPATQYLDTFIVPALRSLQIPDEFLRPDPIHMLAVFISKSGCQLENIHITGERSIPKRRYREAFPSIPKLSFDGFEVNYHDLRR
ncbi:hypothetical protein FB451DRAFT_1383059 [Mycena latifolia]|nr:hypothetical protein FB451DRAFT_1383059 [Mycena latifolia]